MGVAVEVDGDREGGDVGWEALDMDREGRLRAAVSGWSDASGVDPIQQFALDSGELWVGVWLARRARERLLGQQRGLLERAPDTDPDGERRARVGARLLYRVDDELLHRREAFCGGEHLQGAHVVAA